MQKEEKSPKTDKEKNNKNKVSIKEKIKNLSKAKKIIILAILIILLATCIITITIQAVKQIQIKQIENKPLLEYEIKDKKEDNKYAILIKINSLDGIETIKYKGSQDDQEIELKCNGRIIVGIDYEVEDNKDYEFKIKLNGKEETTEILHFETSRIDGNYTLSNGIYVNEPDLTGYNANYTRYLNISDAGYLTPGNWISGDKPDNWYDYKNSKWANIYVEQNGLETYYVWIPRYCFKLDYSTERSDVKFIDVHNNYKDENGNTTKWEELEAEGYQIPEAFEFDNMQLPGYWVMKYTAGERSEYTVDFESVASKTKVKITGVNKNTTQTISKYIYAIDGQIVYESTTADDFSYNITEDKEYIVNVTIINANGEIIGSMTKGATPAKVNEPELIGFNPETTFYVTYDENGNEQSTIPITETAPENWYDYVDSKWANIVTRNNGLETYYVWIPRYEFKLNQTSQRSYVNFKEGTDTSTTDGYQIPEAFWFDKNGDGVQTDDEQLTGFWIMKYTAGG